MLLWHPGPASVSCAACQQWVFDMETGKVSTYWNGTEKAPQPRTGPPPCRLGFECPKVSPDREHEFTLSERSDQMLRCYKSSRATSGRSLGTPDSLTCRAFRLLDELFHERERHEATAELVQILSAVRR